MLRLIKTKFAAQLITATALLILLALTPFPGSAQTTLPGTIISNQATAIYTDELGQPYESTSQTVTVTVLEVRNIAITPDQTASSGNAPRLGHIVRPFTITNTGNTADSYIVTSVSATLPSAVTSLYYDIDNSGTVTTADQLITLGNTVSPRLAPRGSVKVLALIDVNDAELHNLLTFDLRARSTANPSLQDAGNIINKTGTGVWLTSIDDPNLPPEKTIEGERWIATEPGEEVTYSIEFINRGDEPAINVELIDRLPAELTYIAGSVIIGGHHQTDPGGDDGTSVTGQEIVIAIPRLDPGEEVVVRFKAEINTALDPSVINVAWLTGDNFERIRTNEAIALVNPFGVVYAGHSGGRTVINNAKITVLSGTNENEVISLDPQGTEPNEGNQNPFSTAQDGKYNFMLNADQNASPGRPMSYIVRVEAPGFRPRKIAVNIEADPESEALYNTIVRSIDGQPIAMDHSFDLTTNEVIHDEEGVIGFNIPLFENSALMIEKTADKRDADIGDVVSYKVNVQNPTQDAITNVTVQDILPEDFIYAGGSSQVQNTSGAWREITPDVQGSKLSFNLGELAGGDRVTLSYRTRIGASAKAGNHVNTAIANGVFANGSTITTDQAHALVRVNEGLFSNRQIVIGRVYDDVNRNGSFDAGDTPISGARIYTSKGQAVVTDSAGMYNLPFLADGGFTLSLDKISLPRGYAISAKRKDERGFERLMRTPLGGGGLLRQDFVLVKGATADPNLGGLSSKLTNGDDTKKKAKSDTGKAKASTDVVNETKTGTYKEESTEKVDPIEPGVVEIVNPAPNSVVMSPALELEARVAQGWNVLLYVNNVAVNKDNIGVKRLFEASKVEALTFVGINLQPGPNTVTAKAVSPDGREGIEKTITVMGRGPVKKLEMVAARKELQAGGQDTTGFVVKAIDAWGNPAADTQIALSISEGDIRKPVAEEGLPSQRTGVKQQVLSLKDGFTTVMIGAADAPGKGEIKAVSGDVEVADEISYLPELRPNFITGYADASFGNAPIMEARGVDSKFYSRFGFFYRGSIFSKNLLTLSYDSERALNRVNGQDRIFAQDPLDRSYNVFGDSSQRFEDAASNSKLYARLDRGRSYAMFGDFETEMGRLSLAGYTRRSTGVKLHLENAKGDFVSVTGARPNTAFARDVFPGSSLGLVSLTHPDLLEGSEAIRLETRDRRNPDIIVSSERLVRSVDYNIDPVSGYIYFLRPLSGFDSVLNLVQAVVTYEYRADGNSSNVYTGRISKNINSLGLRLGGSFVNQRQDGYGNYYLGGFDGEKATVNGGKLRFEYAMSRGKVAIGGNLSSTDSASGDDFSRNGNAFRVELEQPIHFKESVLRANFARADAEFFNPYGATVTPGSQRAAVSLELKPRASSRMKFGFTDERNKTENVDNGRSTLSVEWTEQFNEKIRAKFGYDYRRFDDQQDDKTVNSNLVTVGVEWKPTDKLELSATREQNLGDADPTYPDQTTFAAKYQLNSLAKIFFTQRLASDAIRPISDVSSTGFGASGAKTETAFGIESKIFKYSSLNGRYQIENGLNGTDSFAVIGLQNRFAINKQSSLDFGFERGFHVAGNGRSFNSLQAGYSWQTEGFKASARYEFRDKTNFGSIFTAGAAGKIGDNITVLGRMQFADGKEEMRNNFSGQGTFSLAYRPLNNDKAGLLFSYNMRSLSQNNTRNGERIDDRTDTLSTDGLWEVFNGFELYGRVAAKFNENSRPDLSPVSTFTVLTQGRAQYRFANSFDAAFEGRYLTQPSSATGRASTAAELGYWLMPDLRLGLGYNFSRAYRPAGVDYKPERSGAYFNITTKLSRLFDLFGSNRTENAPEKLAAVKEEK